MLIKNLSEVDIMLGKLLFVLNCLKSEEFKRFGIRNNVF